MLMMIIDSYKIKKTYNKKLNSINRLNNNQQQIKSNKIPN